MSVFVCPLLAGIGGLARVQGGFVMRASGRRADVSRAETIAPRPTHQTLRVLIEDDVGSETARHLAVKRPILCSGGPSRWESVSIPSQ
jgi:hypothetical protein